MEGCFPDACVTNYESLTSMMTCDPNDRHILAAAVASPAYTLVTFNLKDFPESSYRPYQIEIKDPDCFCVIYLICIIAKSRLSHGI